MLSVRIKLTILALLSISQPISINH